MAGKKSNQSQTKRRKTVTRQSKASTAPKGASKTTPSLKIQLQGMVASQTKSLTATIKQETLNIQKLKANLQKTNAEVTALKTRMNKPTKPGASGKKQLAAQKKQLQTLSKTISTLNQSLKTATTALANARNDLGKSAALNKVFAQFEKDWTKKTKEAAKKALSKPAKTNKKTTKPVAKTVDASPAYTSQPLHTTGSVLSNGIHRENLEPTLTESARLDESSEVTSS